jgi:mRNA interferase MazF
MNIKRGQLIWVDFKEGNGSCQGGKRPAVVVQNNTGNRFSTTTMVIPITSRAKNKLPVHSKLIRDYDIAYKGNIIMVEQLTVIDKSQIIFTGDMLDKEDLRAMERAICIQLNLRTNIA